MLDLASARKALWSVGSSVPYSTATVNDIGEFDFRLMQVVERFYSLGTWRNMWRRLDLAVYGCRLTIPRGFDTCRQIAVCGGSAPIYSQFHRFGGLGVAVDPVGLIGQPSGLRLVDEQAQTFRVPSGTFTLRAVATEVSAEGMTFSGGFDANGAELFGEVTLALVNGAANGTQEYTVLPEIQKAVTTGAVLLYSVDTTSGDATLIASYAPGETIPAYRQYSAVGFSSDRDRDGVADDPVIVSAICKLGFVPAISPNDIVSPGNIGALKLGLQALSYEDKTDPTNAALYWGKTGKMIGAVDLLDAELGELQAAEIPVFSVDSNFACGSIRNVR